jgi:hypothetical protein
MRSSPPPYPDTNYDLPAQLPSQHDNNRDGYSSTMPNHLISNSESESKNEYQPEDEQPQDEEEEDTKK